MNNIQNYDAILIEDIKTLEKYILNAEELGKEFMRVYGTSERVINEVADKARLNDQPISIDGSSGVACDLFKFLQDMTQAYSSFDFRIRKRKLDTNVCVVNKDDEFIFSTLPLNDDERKEYLNHWNQTHNLNYIGRKAFIFRWYPTVELMKFVDNMITKYGNVDVLTKKDYFDKKLSALWEQEWSRIKEEINISKVTKIATQQDMSDSSIHQLTRPSQQKHGVFRGLATTKISGVSIWFLLAFLAFWVILYALYHFISRL